MVKKSCAINLKKGEERASMSECLDRKQVKYYGVEKVNKQTLDDLTSSKMSKAQRNKLVLQMQKLKRKILKGKEEYKKMEAGDKKKKKLEELKKIDKLRIDVVKMLKKFDEKKDKKEKQNKGVDLEDTMSKRLNEMRKQQKKSKDSAKTAQKRVNPWLIHVKKVKEEQNKEMAYKDVLKEAKKTYKPKAKPKEKPKAKQPTNNIIEIFKNNMKKLIDIIYHPDIYEFFDPRMKDDEERDKALTIQHKKDLFMDFKNFRGEEIYYGDDEYEYTKYRKRFIKGLKNKTVQEELKKNKKLNEKVKKLNDLLKIIEAQMVEFMEKEGASDNSDDE